MRLRMKIAVPQFVQVLDLEPGKVYDINPELAEQFLINDMAERADDADRGLEAAALGAARRRG